MTTPEEYRMNKEALQQQVRREQSLTPLRKKLDIGNLHLQASANIAQVQAADAAALKRADDKANKALYGIDDLMRPGTESATRSDYRLAIAEVEKIDTEDRYASRIAAEKMKVSIQTGDEPLRRALGLKASQVGWDEVTQLFEETCSPTQKEALNQLRAPAKPNIVEMLKYANPLPPEFSNARSDYEVEQFVKDNESKAGASSVPGVGAPFHHPNAQVGAN
jgi:hypothetical protein